MALKALVLGRKRTKKLAELEQRKSELAELQKRETEAEKAIEEMDESTTEEDETAINAEVDEVLEEKGKIETAIESIEAEIAAIDEEITVEEERSKQKEILERAKTIQQEPKKAEERKGAIYMPRNKENRSERISKLVREHEGTRVFGEQIRSMIQNRDSSIVNQNILVPEELLPILSEVVEEASKIKKYVNLRKTSGTARQLIEGTFPEAIWVEMYDNINEVKLEFNEVTVDGYKVAGYCSLDNDLVNESVEDLTNRVITALGNSIGYSVDKAIIYGVGIKMPLGFVARLAQTSKPSDYASKNREWVDLSTSNVLTITNKTGAELFQAIIECVKPLNKKYARQGLVWFMNYNTKITLASNALSFNSGGALVSQLNNTMPVVGGNIETLEFMKDGDIAFGYAECYALSERRDVTISKSEHLLFLQDKTITKATALYDGKPAIAEAFGILNIGGVAPTTVIDFPFDAANVADSYLADLKIGTSTLFPQFKPEDLSYMVAKTVTTATSTLTATPVKSDAKVTVKLNNTAVTGDTITWASGDNTLEVTVAYKEYSTTYTVSVTKGTA